MEEFKEASGLVHKPSNYNSGDARSIVLMYDQEEVDQHQPVWCLSNGRACHQRCRQVHQHPSWSSAFHDRSHPQCCQSYHEKKKSINLVFHILLSSWIQNRTKCGPDKVHSIETKCFRAGNSNVLNFKKKKNQHMFTLEELTSCLL